MNNPLSYTDPSGYRWEDDDMDYGDDPWWCSWWCDEIDDDYHGGGGGDGSYAVRNGVDPSSEMDTNGAAPMEALRAMVEMIRKDWKEIYRDSTRRAMQVPGAAVFGAISGVEDLGEAVIGAVEGDLAEVAILGAASRTPGGGAIRRVIGKATARGRAAEPRVLDELGLVKKNRRVSTAEGNSIPDSLTTDQSIEIKDCITVS